MQQSQSQSESADCLQSGLHNTMEEKLNKEYNQRLRRDAPIMLIGDSIIKDIIPDKLSKRNVTKYLYSGKTTEEISRKLDHVKMVPPPLHVIIHVGTNNLPLDSAEDTATKVEQLAVKVKNKFPVAKVAISSITIREEKDLKEKVEASNKCLAQVCSKQNFSYC